LAGVIVRRKKGAGLQRAQLPAGNRDSESNGLFSPPDLKFTGLVHNQGQGPLMKTHRAISCIIILLTAANAQSYTPKDGFVPDSTTAVKVAEAVLIPVYGKEKIESERPFKATLENGIWTVDGALHCSDGKGGVTTACVGGTAEVKLSKADGRVLRMIHYK
jgi:hypothetical protein